MCTAIAYRTKRLYFGRNLDLEYSYHEEVTVTPRAFPIPLRRLPALKTHYAMIGMAYVQDGFPLYYDAVNEKGLCAAGLNFPGRAHYFPEAQNLDNVAPFELIPYLLGTCKTVMEAREKLARLNLAAIAFSEKLPLSPLHWMISGKDGSIVVESTCDGLKIYDDPVEILTNNPPFPAQLERLTDYSALSAFPPENKFSPRLEMKPYSRGMGAMGLPGDFSSPSRFVRAAFVKENSLSDGTETDDIGQFFHMLGAVEQPRGSVRWDDKREITVYSSCCNTETGTYFYITYNNRQICAVKMGEKERSGSALLRYPLREEQTVYYHN